MSTFTSASLKNSETGTPNPSHHRLLPFCILNFLKGAAVIRIPLSKACQYFILHARHAGGSMPAPGNTVFSKKNFVERVFFNPYKGVS